jgi:predicted phage terminase large subunit-like protein
MARVRGSAREVEQLLLGCAETDPAGTIQDLPQDPGQAGKAQKAHLARILSGFDVRFGLESGSKEDRARPLASQLECGNMYLVEGKWNQPFISEAATFPAGRYKDQVDAASRAYARLIPRKRYTRPAAPEIIGDDID